MKKILLVGAALTILSSAAIAQSISADPARQDPANTNPMLVAQADPADDADQPAAAPDDAGPAAHGPKAHGDRGPGGPGGWRHPPMMMPMMGKGAAFLFDGGPRGRILIKCSADDTTQQCVAAVKPLLDQALAARPMPPRPGAPAAPGAEPAPPAQPAPATP